MDNSDLSGYTPATTESNTDSGYAQAVWEALGGPQAMENYDNFWHGEDD